MANKQKMRILYHQFFCGEGNLGESHGFFDLKNGKLEYVAGWDANDAKWRGEYMTGLLSWAGVEIKELPDKKLWEAVALVEKKWGLDYGHVDDQAEDIELYFREGTSDKVYKLELYPDDESEPKTTWIVHARYGRRDGHLKGEIKGERLNFADAKTLYDKVIEQKLKKGYKHA